MDLNHGPLGLNRLGHIPITGRWLTSRAWW
nr:MAG TPA: hypothetical protein [Caudoviricetes sp.]